MNTQNKAMLAAGTLMIATSIVIAALTARKAKKLAKAYIKEGRELDKARLAAADPITV